MSPPGGEQANEGRETIRIHQANERTLLAWLRTGIALMALGFAIARFGVFLHGIAVLRGEGAPGHDPLGAAWIGSTLVACGMLASGSATARFWRNRLAIERGEVGAPSATLAYLFGALITAVGLTMTILLARTL